MAHAQYRPVRTAPVPVPVDDAQRNNNNNMALALPMRHDLSWGERLVDLLEVTDTQGPAWAQAHPYIYQFLFLVLVLALTFVMYRIYKMRLLS
jgi:hypothetical protein